MRLAQLARKLSVRPSEIVSFLAANDIQIIDGSNTRLEDGHVDLVIREFGPFVKDGPEAHIAEAEEIESPALKEVETEIFSAKEVIPETAIPTDPGSEDKPELIKAPKIELSGLKVVGKIDLPEAKKKEQPAEAPVNLSGENESQIKHRKPAPPRKGRPEQKAWKNPLELQREREASEAQKKRETEAKELKEQRTKNYFKKVKTAPPTKRAKLVEEVTMEMSEEELRERPKTLFGRFIKWLRT